MPLSPGCLGTKNSLVQALPILIEDPPSLCHFGRDLLIFRFLASMCSREVVTVTQHVQAVPGASMDLDFEYTLVQGSPRAGAPQLPDITQVLEAAPECSLSC